MAGPKTVFKTPPSAKTCPQCGAPRQQAYRPFCSARHRDLDLGKWLSESYAIPVKDDDYDDQLAPDRPKPRHQK